MRIYENLGATIKIKTYISLQIALLYIYIWCNVHLLLLISDTESKELIIKISSNPLTNAKRRKTQKVYGSSDQRWYNMKYVRICRVRNILENQKLKIIFRMPNSTLRAQLKNRFEISLFISINLGWRLNQNDSLSITCINP